MIRSLWISKTGMEGQQTKLDAISNNLANVGTNGYKRSGVVFEDLMYQNLRQAGAASSEQSQLPSGLQLGLGVRAAATSRNFSQGSLSQTNGNFDVAIEGQGFFQVQMPDGSTSYTRDGGFQLNASGDLVTSAGYTVVGPVRIPPEARTITISKDGQVSVSLPNNPTPQPAGQIQVASFANPGGLEPLGGNLFAETAASGTANAGNPGVNGLGNLRQGFVEGSNVNVVEELVSMIATQRAYELNSKSIQTSDQMLQKLTQL